MIIEALESILAAVISVAAMFVLTKLIGNRAISQMNMFDYINSITIGSIASELAVSEPKDMLQPFIAMVIYAAVVIVLAIAAQKSLKVRRVVEGRSILLMENGRIISRNFKRAKIDINEFLMQCRLLGYFDISKIKTAVSESNGKISVLPFSKDKPVTAGDLKIIPEKENVFSNIILDGEILKENLYRLGLDEKWVFEKLKSEGIDNSEEVFLGIADKDRNLHLFRKSQREDKRDKFDI